MERGDAVSWPRVGGDSQRHSRQLRPGKLGSSKRRRPAGQARPHVAQRQLNTPRCCCASAYERDAYPITLIAYYSSLIALNTRFERDAFIASSHRLHLCLSTAFALGNGEFLFVDAALPADVPLRAEHQQSPADRHHPADPLAQAQPLAEDGN